MILIDSSVWIDLLHDRHTIETAMLTRLITQRRIATADLVLVEVLQGCRSERQAEQIAARMQQMQQITISDSVIAVAAAHNYRTLRGLGITIRKTIDTLIATRCILDGHSLLYSDRDFDPFVEHLGLMSVMTNPTGVN